MLQSQVHLTLPAWLLQDYEQGRVYADDAAQVGLAVELSRRNIEFRSGGPFGAAVFDGEGRLVAAGVNRVMPMSCSIAHAETMAYMLAQQRTQQPRLNQNGGSYTLATSAQPCCQCYGATVWAGVDTLLIGARAEDVMELTQFDEGPLPADWVGELEKRGIAVRRDIHRVDARAVLADYAKLGGETY